MKKKIDIDICRGPDYASTYDTLMVYLKINFYKHETSHIKQETLKLAGTF